MFVHMGVALVSYLAFKVAAAAQHAIDRWT
jgi:hypothetical protein